MFEFGIALMIYSFWISFIGGPVTLFGFRLFYVLSHKIKGVMAAQIVALPLSLGFFYYVKDKSLFKTIYKIVSGFFFALIVIASFFMIYMLK